MLLGRCAKSAIRSQNECRYCQELLSLATVITKSYRISVLDQEQMMRLLYITYSEQGYTCESCGHAINWKYALEIEEGTVKILGSDCAAALLADVDDTLLAKRLRRAARQWNTRKDTRLRDESKEQYVNRRVQEMANARAAWKAAMKLSYYPTPREIVAGIIGCAVEEMGLPDCGLLATACRYAGITPSSEEVIRVTTHLLNAFYQRIDEQYHANVIDWRDKPAYQIVKI